MSEHAPPDTASLSAPADEREAAIAEPPAQRAETGRLRRSLGFFLIAGTVLALDQATKAIIRATLSPGEAWPDADWLLHIVHVTNSGAAFGILQGQTVFLIVTSFLGVAAIVLYYASPPLEHGLLRAALGLQLGGAAGNLIDRIRVGEVTDFVNFEFFPAFNVADASITVGVVAIIGFFLALEIDRMRGPPEAGEAGD